MKSGEHGGQFTSAPGGESEAEPGDEEIFDYRNPPAEFEGAPIVTKKLAINGALAMANSYSIFINKSRDARSAFRDMRGFMKEMRSTGWLSSDHPNHIIWHEWAHFWVANNRSIDKQSMLTNMRALQNPQFHKIALQVSKYAATNGHEFVAETYAAKRAGVKLPQEVLDYYDFLLGEGAI